jgi:alpha-tubulin suppressor-like RCC1 family protein
MSSKRKSDQPVKKPTNKRNKKKVDNDFESDSDEFGSEEHGNGNSEILIHNDALEPLPALPEELLASMEREPGKLVMAGMVTWDLTGRRDNAKVNAKIRPNLWYFHRFTDEKYRLIVSGCASAHSILVNMDRKALSFGRNQFGQLGQPELRTYEKPTLVPGLENFNIIGAACGRNHTLFLTDTGTVYACGDNKSGQCGVGNTTATITKATRINYAGPPIIKVGAGAEFSVILDIKGNMHTFGMFTSYFKNLQSSEVIFFIIL